MLGNGSGNSGGLFVSLIIGSVVGAGLALLFAPQSGKKTRKKIADIADDAWDYASVYAKKIM